MHRESLECLIDARTVLVPLRDLERVVEFPLSPPPPLCEAWVAGIGVVGDEPVVCVTLSGEGRGPQALAKGLLLRAAGGDGPRYLVRVDDVRAVGVATDDGRLPGSPARWVCPEGWLAGRSADTGALHLDPAAVASTLFGALVAAPAEVVP
ncbi:MAG: hypothetical protein U0599_18440 [Vicinamibacteria bacterium]